MATVTASALMRSNPSTATAWRRTCILDGNPKRDEFAKKRISAAKAGSLSTTFEICLKSISGLVVNASTWLAIAFNGGRLHRLTGMVTTSVWKSISGTDSVGWLAGRSVASVTVDGILICSSADVVVFRCSLWLWARQKLKDKF